MIKKLTDKVVAKKFGISSRNLLQTYKRPKNIETGKRIKFWTAEELAIKQEQYKIIRLGATCLHHDVSEDELLEAIEFINKIKG